MWRPRARAIEPIESVNDMLSACTLLVSGWNKTWSAQCLLICRILDSLNKTLCSLLSVCPSVYLILDSFNLITVYHAHSYSWFNRYSLLSQLSRYGCDNFPNSRKTNEKSCIPYPDFGKSRFTGSIKIPNPVKVLCVFPIPTPYFGQIPDPANILPDPVSERVLRRLAVFLFSPYT